MAKSKNVSINEDVLLAFLPKNNYNTLGFPTGSFNQLARQSPIIMATNDNAIDPDDVQLPSIAKRFRIFKTANIRDENVSEVMREIIGDLKKAITDDQREEWIAEGKAEGRVEGKAEGKAEARAQILGNLLAIYPAEALLSDPHFRPMNFTQTEIDAVAATGN